MNIVAWYLPFGLLAKVVRFITIITGLNRQLNGVDSSTSFFINIYICRVTIDAMGCQTEIAEKIKQREAEYILAVKDNQKHLHDDLQEVFKEAKEFESHVLLHSDYGRRKVTF